MGFGILFFGYFVTFAFVMIPTYFFADIVGCFITLWALAVLSGHKAAFRKCVPVDAALAAVSLVRAAGRTFSLFTDDSVPGIVLSVLWSATALLLHFFLTGAIRSLAVEAEDKKIASRANFNRSFSTTVYVFLIAYTLTAGILPAEIGDVGLKLSVLLSLACLLFMSFLIYTSFVCFIPVTGEVKEPEPSKIPFVTAIRKKAYERKKRTLEENRELYREYLDQKEQNRPSKKRKKKK
ncbi:MAG: hypothetical protein IJS78_04625 [Clostridia bacterium]|nr:hypothetical protein [Clostridia bacterium]